jgi:SLT domain-containing protein
VIDPTFQAYHVAGTSYDPYDPVANITAACNYAAQRYGSIDNVFGAY